MKFSRYAGTSVSVICAVKVLDNTGPARYGTLRACRWFTRCAALCALGLAALATTAWAQTKPPTDLSEVSLEDLMNTKVTSVSKKEQKLSRTAAAIYVITQEGIRRSGATNIPDLLRMVPGVDVAQITANSWAISARGFNGQFANKMLVLIDGRTVYDPSISSVFWDAQDLVLEDIERIEVIRGPGATVWGTNAVNGVINIITKSSKETQGGLLRGGGGSVEQGFGTLRYGGKIGEHATYRVFGKYFNRGSFDNLSGQNAADGWNMRHGGFRTDWDISDRDSMTIQGDIYGGVKGEPYPAGPSMTPPFFTSPFTSMKDYSGGNVLARWNHKLQGGSEMSVQTYFDRIARVDSTDPELRSTFDVDFQHHLTLGNRHDIVWGGGYRNNSDSLTGSFRISFHPNRFTSAVENVFVQDDINLVGDKLWITAGTKVEHNMFSGFEVEPCVRLIWTPSKRHTVWLAYSHANRIPARGFDDLRINLAAFPGQGGVVNLVSILGNPQLKSEGLNAYELGYRFEPNKRLSLDIATFYNSYQHLRTWEPGTPFFETTPPPPHFVIPQVFNSKMFGSTYGAEMSAEWNVAKFWTLAGGYAWFVPSLKLEPTSHDTISVSEAEGEAPRNQFQVRSQLNLPHRLEFDTAIYQVGRLAFGNVPGYTRLDARLGWHVAERTELSIVGQNLLDPQHPEFVAQTQSLASTQPKRSVFGEITWRF